MATALTHISECPVCMVKYEDPKVLPCDHSLCANCVERIKRGSRIKCPVCNTQHEVSTVRSDFRLAQFMEALQETQPVQKATTKTDDRPKCELCYRQPVSFCCEDCEQWICHDCKTLHLRSKNSKHHTATPIALKCQEVKDKFTTRSTNIKRKIKLQSETLQNIDGCIRTLQTEQTTALEASDNLRQVSHRDVDEFYDSIDAKIIAFIDSNTRKLETERAKFVKQTVAFKSKWEQLEQMVKDSAAQLAMEGYSIFEEVTKLSEMSQPEDVRIAEVEIKVLSGKAWDASTAAVLELNGGVRVTIALDGGLSSFSNKQFVIQNQVDVKYNPCGLCLCAQQLWVCQGNGTIEIFNQELEAQCTISNTNWGKVYGVTETHTGDMLLAGDRGLFHIKPSGEQISKIDSGIHTSVTGVVFHSYKAYAHARCYRDIPRICIYEYNHNTWKKMNTVEPQFSNLAWVTLSVTNNTITACSDIDDKIIVMSLTGKMLKILGESGSGSPGKLNMPYICQEYLDGSLLIADRDNDRLQTVSQSGQWNIVYMAPKVGQPCGAVFSDNKLYVLSVQPHNLSVYKCKSTSKYTWCSVQ